ncbi:MAG: radical SAM protein, partial [Candidatus Thermoplasmatota archaeon]|nr:radical SAM protein [Candidatus Thermoplasmatota archaeon]
VESAMSEFKMKKLSGSMILAIEPYSGFWAITHKAKDLNKIREEYNNARVILEKRRAFEERKLQISHVEMHLTENCNMMCKYCYVPPALQKQNKKMSINTAKTALLKVVDYAERARLPWITITFHGGEPLLCKDEILEIVEYFSNEKKLTFDIQTNGTLLDESFCKEMKRYQVKIGFSLDGYKIVNDPTRKFKNGTGSFDRIMEGISIYKRYNEKFGGICTVHKYNAAHLEKIVEFFHRIGAYSLFFNPLIPYNKKTIELIAKKSVLINSYKSAILQQININKNSAQNKRIFISNVEALLLNIVADYQPCVCYESPCGAGRIMLVVTSNCDVYPCSEFITSKKFCVGNLLEEGIEKILSSQLCQKLRKRSVNAIPQCSECSYRYICSANCPYSAYFCSGDFFRPPLYCDFYHEIVTFLFQLLDEYGKKLLPFLISNSKVLKSPEMYYEVM